MLIENATLIGTYLRMKLFKLANAFALLYRHASSESPAVNRPQSPIAKIGRLMSRDWWRHECCASRTVDWNGSEASRRECKLMKVRIRPLLLPVLSVMKSEIYR